MKMITGLTKANIRNYGIIRREDLDFEDDGNRFRGFSYMGIPMTQCRSDGICYLSIRVDYLENEFTHREWSKTSEYKLCNEFNGVSEFDMDILIENLQKIREKIDEMNEAAKNAEIDEDRIKEKIKSEIEMVKEVIENFKKNCKWYEMDSRKLENLVRYMKDENGKIERAAWKLENFEKLDRSYKRELEENLNEYGYVFMREDNYFLNCMREVS